MDSKDENMELINEAIKRLLEERKNSQSSAGEGVSQGGGDDDDDEDEDEERLLLHRLLSQLESLKGKGEIRNSETPTKMEEETSSTDGELKPENESCGKADGRGAEIDTEKIVREVNKVKKQNTITHRLLSVMIVLTVAWQASEATFLWKLNEGFRKTPFDASEGCFLFLHSKYLNSPCQFNRKMSLKRRSFRLPSASRGKSENENRITKNTSWLIKKMNDKARTPLEGTELSQAMVPIMRGDVQHDTIDRLLRS